MDQVKEKTKRFIKTKFVLKVIWKNGYFRKTLGLILILIGFIALITPLTPGSWLALIGLGLLGYKAKWFLKLKSRFTKKQTVR